MVDPIIHVAIFLFSYGVAYPAVNIPKNGGATSLHPLRGTMLYIQLGVVLKLARRSDNSQHETTQRECSLA